MIVFIDCLDEPKKQITGTKLLLPSVLSFGQAHQVTILDVISQGLGSFGLDFITLSLDRA